MAQRHVLDAPVTVQVFYRGSEYAFEMWQMTLVIRAFQVHEDANWSATRIQLAIEKLGAPNAVTNADVADGNPVIYCLESVHPYSPNGPNFNPRAYGVTLELEQTQSPIPIVTMAYY